MAEREHKTKYSIYVHPYRQTNPICQQTLRGCRPTFDHHPVSFFVVFAILHLLIGIISICLTNDIKEYKVRYDDKCNLSEENPTGEADIIFDNPALEGELFFYFELHDFYQTYFLTSKKFSVTDLRSKFIDYPLQCQNDTNNTSLPIFPCGIIEQTFFTDNFIFLNSNFSDLDISWRYEKKNLHKKSNQKNITIAPQSLNITDQKSYESVNEHFIVWMRISAHPDFRKLYAKTYSGCVSRLHIKAHCTYSYNLYHGNRYVVLLQPNGLGGRSLVLAIFNFAFLAVNVILILLFEVVTYIKKKNRRRRKLLDGYGEQETQYNLPDSQQEEEDQSDS